MLLFLFTFQGIIDENKLTNFFSVYQKQRQVALISEMIHTGKFYSNYKIIMDMVIFRTLAYSKAFIREFQGSP